MATEQEAAALIDELDKRRSQLKPEQIAIIDELKRRQPTTSAMSRLGGSALRAANPLPALSEVTQRMMAQKPTISDLALGPGAPLIKTVAGPQIEQFKKAGGMLKQGNIPATAAYGAGGLLPGFGPVITGAGEQWRSGDIAGAIGTFGGAVGAGEAMGGLTRGVGSLMRKTALPLYRSTLTFPEALDLPSRPAAAMTGLRDLRAMTSERPGGLPSVEEFIRQKTAEVDAKVTEAEQQGQEVDLLPVYKAVNEEVNTYTKSLAPDDPLADAARIRDQIWKRLGAKKTTIRIDTSMEPRKPRLEAPHIVKKPEPLYKEVEVMGPPERRMKPILAQEAKRATSHALRKSYDVEKSAGIETLKAGERGLKEAMEGVADVKDLNWQEHVAITLKDAMERTLKRNPQFLDRYGAAIMIGGAIGTGTEVFMGDLTKAAAAAGTTVASLIVEKALRNPATLSRLAIALDRAGTLAPDMAKAIRLAPALTLGRAVTPPLPPSRFDQEQTGQK
jgi:hypothetical protein